ncbi:MAG: DUF4838 domain-containing protein [Lachnospirales bacterium]
MLINENTIIILPKKPSPVEEFSAKELQKYIKKITNISLPIGTTIDSTKSTKIIIGNPKSNKIMTEYISEENFVNEIPGPEGIFIKSFNNSLVLAGSIGGALERDRGTLYAVYEFLERYCNCSFVAYGDVNSNIGEYIPKLKNIEIDNISYKKEKSDLPYRGTVVQFDAFEVNSLPHHKLTPLLIDWFGKNRINRVMLMLTSYEHIKKSKLYDEFKKRGISMTVGHHDSGMFFLPPHGNDFFSKKYYETNPEYYRKEVDGTRFDPPSKWHGQLIFDMRNSKCIEEIATNIIDWINVNPYVDIINFWPNDDVSPCCSCELCRNYSKNENYVWMTNEIAKLIALIHPNVQIDLLVYQDIWTAPENMELSKNLLIDIATWGPNMIRKFGCNDGSGLIGSPTEKNALKWARYTNNLVYYDYYMTNFGSNQVYCPMSDEIVKIYEHFVETKYAKGTATQMEPYNIWNYLFNFYVHGRKSYDISLTFDALISNFVKIFGNASRHIKEYIEYIEDFSNGQGVNGNECAAYFATHVDKEKVYELFENAYLSLDEGVLKDNLRLLRMAFRYSDLQTNDPDSEEIIYITNNFGSFWGELGQVGYGISAYAKPNITTFKPDKWYNFTANMH